MLPRDWTGDDPAAAREYLEQLKEWKDERDKLVQRQANARQTLDAASARLGVLTGWRDALPPLREPLAQQRRPYEADLAEVDAIGRELDRLRGLLADRQESYAVATSRLLGDVPVEQPIVLLPVRLETHWTPDALLVRIFPDDIGINSHDPRLTPAERAAGKRYWEAIARATSGPAGTALTDQAWEELVRQTGAPRAAWVVRSTDPAQPAPPGKDSGWELAVSADLLPDRFAVVAISGQTFRARSPAVTAGGAGASTAPHFVTWGAPVPSALPYALLGETSAASWLSDFAVAEANGMAVRVPLTPGEAPVEGLLVVGVRGGTASEDLDELLSAHAFSSGAELLADGAPTNNSREVRAAHGADQQAAAAQAHLSGGTTPPSNSAGEQLATLLGVDPTVIGGWRGADVPRRDTQAALALLVGFGTDGALRDALGPDDQAWPLVGACGPGPTMLLGRQPYGVLPASAMARWAPQPGELGGALVNALHTWGHSVGPPDQIDPLDPPRPPGNGGAAPRIAGHTDDLEPLLLEQPSANVWTHDGKAYAGITALVGSVDGPTSPAAYLIAIAGADPAEIPALVPTLPPLLAQIALAAKGAAAHPAAQTAVDDALRALAANIAPAGDGLAALAALFTATLDAASHRFDAWITSTVTERLRAQRTTGAPTRVGAYGWLLDLRPATAPRSAGHVLAPSLAHAATAAVLRAGYLAEVAAGGQVDGSRQPMAVDLSSARVRGALATLTAVRAGQPLAAVLGRSFEDDLIAAGLQRYLATFRKLTRFRTGGQLEHLEQARADAVATLAQRRAELVERQAKTARNTRNAAAAAEILRQAQAAQQAAETAAAPYLTMQARIGQLDTALLPAKAAELAAIDAQRPVVGTHTRTITVPVP
ncbi:hypothetical protein [Streptomyces chartreusis]